MTNRTKYTSTYTFDRFFGSCIVAKSFLLWKLSFGNVFFVLIVLLFTLHSPCLQTRIIPHVIYSGHASNKAFERQLGTFHKANSLFPSQDCQKQEIMINMNTKPRKDDSQPQTARLKTKKLL